VDPGPFFTFILPSTASTDYFPQALFIYLLQTNIIFHTICLIHCFQQTSEIDNLTASWGKYFGCVVCSFHVAAAPVVRPAKSQLASTFRSGFFLLLVD
jgi:hypothetical protein